MQDDYFKEFEVETAEELTPTSSALPTAPAAPEKPAQPEKPLAPPKPKKRKRKYPWAFPLGVVMLLLTLVGIGTIVSAVVGFIREKTDNTEELEHYNQYLTWVVANDPDSFDDISKANMTHLLDISILSLIYDSVNTADYELTDEGLRVPVAQVEAYYKKLFGTELPIVHGTVSQTAYTFTYNAQNACYYVPVTGVTPPFTPRVTAVNKARESIVITVGYIGTEKLSVAADGSIKAAEPDKYMNITLRKSGGVFCIYAIQAANAPETGS